MTWLIVVAANTCKPTSGEIGGAAPVSIVSFVLIIAVSLRVSVVFVE